MSQPTDCQNTFTIGIIALGSNVTSTEKGPKATLLSAMRRLDSADIKVLNRSSIYKTPAFPVGSGPDFANSAVLVESELSAESVLKVLNELEIEFGRTRTQRWEPRILDLDLIFFGDRVLPSEEEYRHWFNLPLEEQKKVAPTQLILPHPRVQERGFVLRPILDIAPDWMHPILGKTVNQLFDALTDAQKSEITLYP